MTALGGLASLLGRGRRVTRTGFAQLTSKNGPRNFYKGKGCLPTGQHTKKGGTYWRARMGHSSERRFPQLGMRKQDPLSFDCQQVAMFSRHGACLRSWSQISASSMWVVVEPGDRRSGEPARPFSVLALCMSCLLNLSIEPIPCIHPCTAEAICGGVHLVSLQVAAVPVEIGPFIILAGFQATLPSHRDLLLMSERLLFAGSCVNCLLGVQSHRTCRTLTNAVCRRLLMGRRPCK